MLSILGIAILIYGVIYFRNIGKYKLLKVDYSVHLVLLSIPFFTIADNGWSTWGQALVSLLVVLVFFILIPYLVVGSVVSVYMNLGDLEKLVDGMKLFEKSDMSVMRDGSKLYTFEDGLKVRIGGSGRLRISIRQGLKIKRISAFRKELVNVLVAYDERKFTKKEAIIILIGGLGFILADMIF